MHAHDQQPALRFVWATSGEGRLTALSRPAADALGIDPSAISLLSWSDITTIIRLEASALEAALAAGRPFADVRAEGDGVSLTLTGSPDPGGKGFRGFGLLRMAPQRASAAEDRMAGTIVHLPRAPGEENAARPAPCLGPEERMAFREIARALGARIEDEEEEEAPVPAPVAPRRGAGALLEALPIGAVVHRGTMVLKVNKAFLALVGAPDLAAFEAAGGLAALMPETPEGEAPRPLAIRRIDGRTVPVEARLASLDWEEGPAALLLLEEREAESREADLMARVAELEAILDTATDGVLIVDALGVVRSANRSAEALFEAEPPGLVGRRFVELFAEESRKLLLDDLERRARDGVEGLLQGGREVIGLAGKAGMVPLSVTIGRVGERGSARFCALLRDLSVWKKSEEELVSARRRAEEASAHKSDFLARISHEIRTPLNAIIGFAEVMLEERFGPVGNARYKGYLRDIHASGTHLMSLVNDLLDLSKIEAGGLDLEFRSVDLAEVVMHATAMMQPQANARHIVIRTSLHERVPPVLADPRSLKQIVLNLLSNAVKFTSAGGQVIVSTAREDDGSVALRVRDTGAGMSEADIATALQPFRRLDNRENDAGGTGLGLPLTKAMAEANRASFSIESTPGRGTLVRIVFPPQRVAAG